MRWLAAAWCALLAGCTLLYTEDGHAEHAAPVPSSEASSAPVNGLSIPTPLGTVTASGIAAVLLVAALFAWWFWEKRKARATAS